MITDLLKFTVKEAFIEEALECVKEQAIQIRDEDGCVMSKVFRSKTNPNELYMLFGWENRRDIQRLQQTEHNKKFRKNMDSKISCPAELFDWETII
ncbi:MAG: antibiotic biosynthesis monooxygenase [Oscillospiraceae bacterium]|nr:antibiotic biosynthesis monooxygenase [Oscillospiraceae bacterium]